MLNKFKNHCKNPITWGAYYKLCGVCLLASFGIGIATVIQMKYEDNKFNKRLYEIDSDDVSEEEES